jgi:hypothetical protein
METAPDVLVAIDSQQSTAHILDFTNHGRVLFKPQLPHQQHLAFY